MIGRDLHPALPRHLCRGLAAGMRQLNGDPHVGPAPDALQRPGDRGFRLVVPESHIGVGNPCLGQDGGRLDGQQRRTRERKMAEMDQVPVGHAAIDGRVLAHRRDDDAVGQLEGTDPKRCKQRAHANFSIFSVEPVGRCRPIFLTPRSELFDGAASAVPRSISLQLCRPRQ